ncbi:MAG: hypothetical protein HY973_00750 [Candidatus Kerfeldbacteria bacterium]|nr:hypothetical protein [Candidatus Kerfeldbacteria bacterium]
MRLTKSLFSRNFVLTILCLNVLLWTVGSLVQRQADLSKASPGITWFREDNDFLIYFIGRGWIKPDYLLYQQGYAEYPPLGVLYVWWPRLLTDNFEVYHWLLWISNGLFYVLAGWLTWRIAKIWQHGEAAWWLWLLPSVAYYSFNRFDIFPVVLLLLAVYSYGQNRVRLSGLCYGASIMAKFFPLLLFPLFWQLSKNQKPRNSVKFILYSLLPPLAFSLAVGLVGGSAAIFSPYILQMERSFEPGTIWFLLTFVWPQINELVRSVTSLGQVIIPVVWGFQTLVNKLTATLLVNYHLAALTLLVFIFFNHFYSNQWWLWVVPWLAWIFPPQLFYWLGFYDILNYWQYPIAAELWGKASVAFNLAVVVRGGVLLVIIAILVKQLINQKRKNIYENLAGNPHL